MVCQLPLQKERSCKLEIIKTPLISGLLQVPISKVFDLFLLYLVKLDFLNQNMFTLFELLALQ